VVQGDSFQYFGLEGTGAVSLAEAIARVLSASLVELDLEGNDTQENGGRALADTLRNTTLTAMRFCRNDLGEGGGRTQTETLRLNYTLTSIDLGYNSLVEGGGRSTLGCSSRQRHPDVPGRHTEPQPEGAIPWLQ